MCIRDRSNIELKTEINKQDEKLREINNEFVNIRSEIKYIATYRLRLLETSSQS